MLGIIAVVLLIVWIGGLALHLLGGFVHIFIVLAVIAAVVHFLKGKSPQRLP